MWILNPNNAEFFACGEENLEVSIIKMLNSMPFRFNTSNK